MISPRVVIGDNALNALVCEVCPVPPFAIAIAVPFQTPVAIVPTEVKELFTTVEFKVVPLKEPAEAATAAVVIEVINPLPFTVNTGIALPDPNDPGVEFTVARVKGIE